MCDKVVELVKEWGFENYASAFEENEVDMTALMSLEYEGLRDLIPKVGPRTKFFEKLKKFKTGPDDIESLRSDSTVTILSAASDDIIDTTLMNSTFVQEIVDLTVPSQSTALDNNYILNVDLSDNAPINLVQHAFKEASRSNLAFCGANMLEKAMSSAYNLDLRSFLQKTQQGLFVLNYYEKFKNLSSKPRNILVDLLINGLMSEINAKIRSLDFEVLAEKIVELFPSETKYTYYIPRVSSKDSSHNKAVNPKGKLIDKYRNLTRIYNLRDNLNKKPPMDENKSPNVSSEDDEIKKCATWLKHWTEPWNLVLDNWKKTFNMRAHNDAQTVKQFLQEWPILKQSNAFPLIEYDFNQLFPDCTTNFFIKWNAFFKKLRTITSVDKHGLELLDLLETNFSDDTRIAIEMMSLPNMLPPKSRVRCKGVGFWKPSISECRESIINHVKVTGDVESFITERRNKFEKLKRPIQPYIIVVGADITKIEESYLIIDDNIYSSDNISKSFDMVFKIFHVFHAEYPIESEHIWFLIQKVIYKIETKWDKQIPHILTIINEMLES